MVIKIPNVVNTSLGVAEIFPREFPFTPWFLVQVVCVRFLGKLNLSDTNSIFWANEVCLTAIYKYRLMTGRLYWKCSVYKCR